MTTKHFVSKAEERRYKRAKQPRCSICDERLRPWPGNKDGKYGANAYGHNAAPVNNGRCCDVCNDTVVIPTRIKILMRKEKV